MPHDYIPRPDGDFSAWANHYSKAVHDWWAAQGLDPTDLKPLEDALALWNKDYAAHVAARAKAEAAAAAKRHARHGSPTSGAGVPPVIPPLEAEARRLAAFIQAYPTTTDADRATIGITVREGGGAPVTTPTTRPQAVVQAGQRLTHTLRLTDESTPTRRARPRGVLGAEVWVKLVEPNGQMASGQMAKSGQANTASFDAARSLGDPATFAFLTMATKPSVTAEYRAADGGKTAVYMLRWVSTRGEKGPWSDVTTATVAA
ncbi:MAG: hypothetical protein AB7G11_16625 [Phycisphaerales bacterium]